MLLSDHDGREDTDISVKLAPDEADRVKPATQHWAKCSGQRGGRGSMRGGRRGAKRGGRRPKGAAQRGRGRSKVKAKAKPKRMTKAKQQQKEGNRRSSRIAEKKVIGANLQPTHLVSCFRREKPRTDPPGQRGADGTRTQIPMRLDRAPVCRNWTAPITADRGLCALSFVSLIFMLLPTDIAHAICDTSCPRPVE